MPQPNQTNQIQDERKPLSVVAAKAVDLVLVTYIDESGREVTQICIVGDKNVHLLESRTLGFSNFTTPQGLANDRLAKGIFEKLRPTKV